jgi:hypothetical protein
MEIMGVELELWLGLLVAVTALVIWGMKKYQSIQADGKITLDEVISSIEESEELIDTVVDEAEKVAAARKCGVCGETGHDRRKCPQNV